MQPEDRNLAYLWDMREAAREISGFVKGLKYTEFIENLVVRYAVERQLMVIGEAANHVSEKFQDEHPKSLGARWLDNAMFLSTNMGTSILNESGVLR
jgi:uncharacterized protein with HEPN domain